MGRADRVGVKGSNVWQHLGEEQWSSFSGEDFDWRRDVFTREDGVLVLVLMAVVVGDADGVCVDGGGGDGGSGGGGGSGDGVGDCGEFGRLA